MKKIKVIDTEVHEVQDRASYYNSLKDSLPQFSPAVFDMLMDMELEEVKVSELFKIPSIRSSIIQKILSFPGIYAVVTADDITKSSHEIVSMNTYKIFYREDLANGILRPYMRNKFNLDGFILTTDFPVDVRIPTIHYREDIVTDVVISGKYTAPVLMKILWKDSELGSYDKLGLKSREILTRYGIDDASTISIYEVLFDDMGKVMDYIISVNFLSNYFPTYALYKPLNGYLSKSSKIVTSIIESLNSPYEAIPYKSDKFIEWDKVINLLSQVVISEFGKDFRTTLVADLNYTGLLGLVQYTLCTEDTEPLKKYIEEQKRQIHNRFEFQSVEVSRLKNLVRELNYRRIYQDMFGSKYSNIYPTINYELPGKKLWRLAEPIFDKIGKQERLIIEREYIKRENYTKSIHNNDCKHVPILIKLRISEGIEDRKKLFAELKLFLGKEDGMINCSNCKFPIICPHLKSILESERIDNDAYTKIIATYADKTPFEDAYYCKICGEMIAPVDRTSTDIDFIGRGGTSGYSEVENELLNSIWNNAVIIIRRNVEFASLTTEKAIYNFATKVAGAVYPYMQGIERKLNRSKTSTIEETSSRIKYYSIIYIYAILIKIIKDNPSKIKFKKDPKFTKINIDATMRKISDLINAQNSVLMSKIPGLSDFTTRMYLAKSYDNIKDLGKSTIDDSKTEESLVYNIMADPIYHYWLYIKNIDAMLNKKRTYSIEDIEDVLGVSAEVLKKSEFVYEKAVVPTLKTEGKFINILDYYKDTTVTDMNLELAELQIESSIEGFRALMEYVKNQLFIIPQYQNGKLITQYQDFYDKCSKLRESEDILYYIRKHQYIAPHKFLLYLDDFRIHTVDVDLSKVYGYDGKKTHKHVWNIYKYYILEEDASKILDKKAKQELEQGGKHVYLEDMQCSICKEFHSKISIPDIQKHLDNERRIEDFFNYFLFRCPAESKPDMMELTEPHDWKGEKCAKCGITMEELYNNNEDYYNKYKSSFKIDIKKIDISFPKSEYTPKIKEWKGKDNIVLQFVESTFDIFSKGSKLPGAIEYKYNKREYFNIISNLGLVEGYEFDNILSGNSNPSKEPDYDKMFNRINSYNQVLISNFYMIKNSKNLSKFPLYFKPLIDKDVKSKLDEYYPILDDIRYSGSVRDLALYAREYLLSQIAKLFKEFPDYAYFTLAYIIDCEIKLAAIPQKQIISIKYQPEADSNLDYEIESNMYDNLVDPDIAETLSMDAMDYEETENDTIEPYI